MLPRAHVVVRVERLERPISCPITHLPWPRDGPIATRPTLRGFPFFIVPSLMDKKMAGPFQLSVYSDKAIVVQKLDDGARKL